MAETPSLIQLNERILRELNNMIKSFKELEKRDVKLEEFGITEKRELEAFEQLHNEVLAKHPEYARIISQEKATDEAIVARRLQIIKSIRNEFGPIIELIRLLNEEQKMIKEQVLPELAKEFEFKTEDHQGDTGFEVVLIGSKKPVHVYFITRFKGDSERQKFKGDFNSTINNSLGLRKFLLEHFEGRIYTNDDQYHKPPGGKYFVCKDDKINNEYGALEVHRAIDPPGVDFNTWVDNKKLVDFCAAGETGLNPRFSLQMKAFDDIKVKTDVIKAAETAIAQQLEAVKKDQDAQLKDVKSKVEDFEEVYKGKIPKKYIPFVQKLKKPKYLLDVIRRARDSSDPRFKDQPLEILKRDVDEEINRDVKITVNNEEHELKDLIIKELAEPLRHQLQLLAGRSPDNIIKDLMKEIVDDFKKFKTKFSAPAAFTSERDGKLLAEKIGKERELITTTQQLGVKERVLRAKQFNSIIVYIIKSYTSQKPPFTEAEVRAAVPQLREI